MNIAIDVGFGFTKAAAPDGRRCCFPSVVAPAAGQGDLAGLTGGQPFRHRLNLQRAEYDPENWLVGDAALVAGGARTWDTEASHRADYDTLTLAALALLGARGQVQLAVGLPLAVWLQKPERRALRERLLGLGAWIGVDGDDARYVEVSACRVYPQAVGAYFAALAQDVALAGRYVGVVDIGYRTTDCVLFIPADDGVSAPDEQLSGSFDAGVGQAEDLVVKALEREVGGFVEPSIVLRSLHCTGSLSVAGSERDLRPAYEEACHQVAGIIKAHILHLWPDRILKLLHAVLLAGGGGAALEPHLGLPSLRLVRDAMYANADGFLRMACNSVHSQVQ